MFITFIRELIAIISGGSRRKCMRFLEKRMRFSKICMRFSKKRMRF